MAKAKVATPRTQPGVPFLEGPFRQGREAARSHIAREDAPYGDGMELDAWRAGYDYETTHNG